MIKQQSCIKSFLRKLATTLNNQESLFLVVDSLAAYTVQTFISNNEEALKQSNTIDGVVYVNANQTHLQIQKQYKGAMFKMLSRVAPSLQIPTTPSAIVSTSQALQSQNASAT